jgi:hypothetical protein
MNKPVVNPVPVTKPLAEQKSDFTAEGSPPQGKASTTTPDGTPEAEQASPARRPVRGTITLQRIAARASS